MVVQYVGDSWLYICCNEITMYTKYSTDDGNSDNKLSVVIFPIKYFAQIIKYDVMWSDKISKK